ncbi:MAG TPA: transporter associated domain-containing protein, partial [Tenuifilum sp.]|nr:transporter associated domain-containing protein [Tenuifilum sp.]
DFFPETMKANELLTHFIKAHKSMAIVVDEFGGTSGLVTIEDIIEEIFGEIDDEHDLNELVEKKLSDKEYILSGRVEVSHVNEAYGLGIPESDEYETIAGFILHHYQSLPKPGDSLKIQNFEFKILRVNKTRIDLVRLVID